MREENANGLETEAGIISFKNMKTGFMNFCFKDNIERSIPAINVIDTTILDEFRTQLVSLINEILNPEIAFEEKMD